MSRFTITHTRRWTIDKNDNGAAIFLDGDTGKTLVILGVDSGMWSYVLDALNEKATRDPTSTEDDSAVPERPSA